MSRLIDQQLNTCSSLRQVQNLYFFMGLTLKASSQRTHVSDLLPTNQDEEKVFKINNNYHFM